jgi:3-oxoacyl-[acyl-carrier protein] reductase
VTRAILTGASRGIGRATALELGRRNVELTLIGRPSTKLDEVAKQTNAHVVHWDLAEGAHAAAAGKETLRAGTPNIVIHNAGVIERASIEETSLESYDRQMAINLRAPFLLTRELLPAMKRAGSGRFLFIGSIAGTVGTARASVYCASKWGLTGLMKSLAAELSGTGLSSVALLPGSVDTEMLAGSGFAPRMTAEDVARTIAWYALEAPLAHNGGVVELFGT